MSSVVQVAHGYSTTGTVTATLPNAVTGGHQLMVIVTTNTKTAFTVSSIADSSSDTFDLTAFPWSQIGTPNGSNAVGVGIYIATSAVGSSGSNSETFTVTLSGAYSAEIYVAELNIGFVPALDVSVPISTSPNTTFATTISTNSPDFIVAVGGTAYSGETQPTWNNGFTGADFDGSQATSYGWGYLQQASAGQAEPSVTYTQSENGGIMAVGLKNPLAPYVNSVNGSIVAPVQNTISTSSTGGSLSSGTYTYYFTAYNSTGETNPSNLQSIYISSGSTNSNSVSCASVAGASGYRLYKNYIGASSLNLVYDLGSATSFTDTGTAGTPAMGLPPSANTTAPPLAEGATSVAIAGNNFEAGMTATISQGSNSVAQSNVVYSSRTDATFDLVMEPIIGAQLAFTDSTYSAAITVKTPYETTGPFDISLVPRSGNIFVTLTSVSQVSPQRIQTIPDLAVGDQIEASGNSTGTAAAPAGLTLNPDGTFEYTNSAWTNFWVRVYKASDSAWTPWAEIVCTGLAQADGFD